MPFGVMSKSHVKIRVMGNPRDDHQHDKSLRQRGHFENRKDLRDDLDDEPAGHGIGGADLVDMAALQLGEEIREIHGEALPWFDMYIFATGTGKRALLSRLIQNPEI